MKAVCLQPRGAYRNPLHSDTLFGLICWAIRQVFSEDRLVRSLAAFADGRPPFLVSSAFPCTRDGAGWKFFLPRPLLEPPSTTAGPSPEEAQRYKEYKRLRYIPAAHFTQFLEGDHGDGSYYACGDWEKLELPIRWRTDRLHSAIDRLSGTTDGEGTLFTRPEYRTSGLYFLLDGEETELVTAALRFLEDFGWGGGNSAGHGHFAADVRESPLGMPVAAPDRFITLSLYYPRPDELAHFRTGEAWYDLAVRRGKVGGHFLRTSDFWKRSVMMFAPGSTFPVMPGRKLYGHNPIVKSRQDGLPFDVQQFGYAFAVGMKANTAGE